MQTELSSHGADALFHRAPQPLLVYDARSLRLLEANEAAVRTYGYPRGDLLRMTLPDLHPPDEAERVRAELASDRPLGRVEGATAVHRLRDGTRIDVEVSADDVTFAGRPARVASVTDVTARQRALDALRQSETRFRQAAEYAPIGMALVGTDGTFVMVNRALCELFGFPEAELLRLRFHDVTHPDDLEADVANVRALLEGEAVSYTMEKRYLRRDGTGVPALLTVSLVRDARGRPLHFISQVQDISERKAAEEALRSSEELFRSLTENASDVTTVLAEDGTIRYESPSVQRVLGYDPRELEGRNVMDLVHSDDRALAGEALERRIREPGTVQTTMVRFQHRDGTWRHLEARASNRLHDPAVRGIVVNSRDVTERIQSQERLGLYSRELERSNRELEEFAYVASHDLQEPLRKIQAFGDRLRALSADVLGEQGADYVARMQRAASRMQRLIEDLLEFSRVRTRGRPFGPVRLEAVAREVVSDLEPRLQQTGGAIEVGPLPPVVADPVQMRQLLQNLLVNAVKFHRPGVPPRVRVSGRRVPGGTGAAAVELRVEDEGIGFDERYLDRIFNPFQRLHGRGEYEGTGMGLAICRRIAERHGGTITARSAPGEGATFVVVIPEHPPQPEETP